MTFRHSDHRRPTSFVRRFLLENLDICGAIVKLTDVWQALRHERDYSPVLARLLGEMATVCAMIAGNLKQSGRLTIQAQGNGPIRLLALDCTSALNLRGYARGDCVTEDDLSLLLGDGQLQLSLETRAQAQPYQSIVPLEGNSIAEVFAHYLGQSEQQPAGLWIASDQGTSAALFLQKMPGADTKDPDGWTRALTLAQTVQDEELLELDSAPLLHRLFSQEDTRLYPARIVTHNWPREPEKIADMLLSIGEAEVREMLAENGGEVIVRDEMSNHTYRFEEADVDGIFQSRVLH